MAFTNADGKFYICETAKSADLTQAEYEALTWVEVKNVGSLPESGTNTNVVSYDTLDTDVTQKAKGISNAGDGTLELSRLATDPGQVALRNAANTKFYYATKRVLTDAPDATFENTTYYNRGLITGPVHAGGRNEDFILETYTFGYVQKEIVVNPVASVAPTNTVLPAISGIAQVGQTLTAYVGTWTGNPTSYTYQWEADALGNGTYAAISGATAATYLITASEQGDSIRLVVTAVNGAGSTAATSAGTKVVIAA